MTDTISTDLDAQHARLVELHIDRAYLASTLVRDRSDDLVIYRKAWRVRNTGGRFAKTDFRLDFDRGELTAPIRSPWPSNQAAQSGSPPKSARAVRRVPSAPPAPPGARSASIPTSNR